jgi:hypothetical protein
LAWLQFPFSSLALEEHTQETYQLELVPQLVAFLKQQERWPNYQVL